MLGNIIWTFFGNCCAFLLSGLRLDWIVFQFFNRLQRVSITRNRLKMVPLVFEDDSSYRQSSPISNFHRRRLIFNLFKVNNCFVAVLEIRFPGVSTPSFYIDDSVLMCSTVQFHSTGFWKLHIKLWFIYKITRPNKLLSYSLHFVSLMIIIVTIEMSYMTSIDYRSNLY